MNATREKQDHGRQNAKAWAESIAEMVAALECDFDRLEELRDERADIMSRLEEAKKEEIKHDELEAQRELADWDTSNAEELAELEAAATINGDKLKDADEARERITESPLSIQVRGGWYSPGEDKPDAEEFEILLTTGGPALRIRGELGEHNEPDRAWLEYQDWGTPWTEYCGEGCERSTLLTFCQQFFFGE